MMSQRRRRALILPFPDRARRAPLAAMPLPGRQTHGHQQTPLSTDILMSYCWPPFSPWFFFDTLASKFDFTTKQQHQWLR